MSDQPKETLSALMDNEVSDFELRSLLRQTDENEELSSRWHRYHLASSALKQEQLGKGDISVSVMAAIEEEETYHAGQPAQQEENGFLTTFFKPLASMAVAASVTAVVILGGQNYGVGKQAETPAVAQAPVATQNPFGFTVPRDVLQAQYGASEKSATQESSNVIRLNWDLANYISQHRSLVNSAKVTAHPEWLPAGFSPVKNALTPDSDLTVYSNGESSFTICVENAGDAKVPEGATQIGDMVAVGKKIDQYFVTVVGDVPLMVADKVVNSVGNIH